MKLRYVILSKIMSFLTGWISVDDRLPKHKNINVRLGIICFCLLQGYYPAICLFSPYDKKWYRENGNQDVTSYVSHWKKSTAPDIFFHEWSILKGHDVFNPTPTKAGER